MWVYSSDSFYPPFPSPISPTPYQIHDLFFIIGTYIHVCVDVCNLLNPLSIACIYKCAMLTTWDYLTDQGLIPDSPSLGSY